MGFNASGSRCINPGEDPGGECRFFLAFLDFRDDVLFFISYSTGIVDNYNK